MRILEHHSKALLRERAIPCPRGRECGTAREAAEAVADLGPVALKALVPAGGRGKAGGVRFAESEGEAEREAAKLLGAQVLGYKVESLLVESRVDGEELFVSWTYDLDEGMPVLLASARGGVDIEETVETDGGALGRYLHDPQKEFFPFQARRFARDELGLSGRAAAAFGFFAAQLYQVFRDNDAWLVEVNPAVLTGSELIAVSAVVELDDAAEYRHASWSGLASHRSRSPLETMVDEVDRADRQTSGVRFQEIAGGDILYLVFGGGSGLAYFDYLHERGFKPATYVDVSPGRGLEKVRAVFDAALSLEPLRGIVFTLPHSNLAGVDQIVEQFVAAYEERGSQWSGVPMVVRVCGPGEERARTLMEPIDCLLFSDEVTIEEAIDSLLELLDSSAQ